jgi:hypothetical protein
VLESTSWQERQTYNSPGVPDGASVGSGTTVPYRRWCRSSTVSWLAGAAETARPAGMKTISVNDSDIVT